MLKSRTILSLVGLNCVSLTPADVNILSDALVASVSLYLLDKYTISFMPD